jgi:hypothetical protein
MEQVVGIETLCAYLFLAFKAEEDVVSGMERALILSNFSFHFNRRIFSLLTFLEFSNRILNLNIFGEPQIYIIKIEDYSITLLTFPIRFHAIFLFLS